MSHPAVDPTPCPACGHPVYPRLLTPVAHEQHACRAVLTPGGTAADRCGCGHPDHHVGVLRPRHRAAPVDLAG